MNQSENLLDEKTLTKLIELITQKTGIIPRDSHRSCIKNYVEKRMKELEEVSNSNKISPETFLSLIEVNPVEMALLINSSTVNETYFFREEAQFDVLEQKVFPDLKAKNPITIPITPIRIWSAACSTGEEIYSILLLAESLGIKTECTASDINTTVLEKCKSGFYRKNAIRSVDGAKYQKLLEQYKTGTGEFQLSEKLRSSIITKHINLSDLTDFPKNQNIIFIRNVFIYFSNEMKKQILTKIAEESLAPGGYIFVSMNEVAVLDSLMIPDCLEQIHDGKVFYFHKKVGK
ncbi:MAG: hypothetical protein J6W60_02945 [Treponema sp.]|nr:hypothetical protein [Treponema sp.]